jgi:hypothetical protein
MQQRDGAVLEDVEEGAGGAVAGLGLARLHLLGVGQRQGAGDAQQADEGRRDLDALGLAFRRIGLQGGDLAGREGQRQRVAKAQLGAGEVPGAAGWACQRCSRRTAWWKANGEGSCSSRSTGACGASRAGPVSVGPAPSVEASSRFMAGLRSAPGRRCGAGS